MTSERQYPTQELIDSLFGTKAPKKGGRPKKYSTGEEAHRAKVEYARRYNSDNAEHIRELNRLNYQKKKERLASEPVTDEVTLLKEEVARLKEIINEEGLRSSRGASHHEAKSPTRKVKIVTKACQQDVSV